MKLEWIYHRRTNNIETNTLSFKIPVEYIDMIKKGFYKVTIEKLTIVGDD